MKHVFHVIAKCDLGGAEQVAAYLASSTNEEFHYHVCEVFHSDSAFSEVFIKELRQKKVSVHCSPFRKKRWAIVFFPFLLFKLAKVYRPSVIHTHTEVPDLAVYLFYHLFAPFLSFKISCVRTIHNTVLWNKWKKIGGVIEHFYARKCTNVAISLRVKENYRQLYGGRSIPVIYNGLSAAFDKKEFPSLKKGKKNVLFAGRFDYQKGIDTLIQVVNALEKDEGYFFHLVGAGPLKEILVQSLNTSNNQLYEPIFGISRYLSSFDLLFMPSLFEGLSMLAIEAGMNQTLLVANACQGIVEVLPPDWELLVKDNSVEGYLRIFKEVIPSVDYSFLAEKAFDHAVKNFSLHRMQREYEALYNVCESV